MMRWLARLLHPKRKKPRRPEARVLLALPDPVMGVLSKTADVITDTLKERGRQHRQARRASPPLPAPRPTAADKDASPKTPRPPPKATSQQQQALPTPAPASGAHSTDAAILTDLKRASTAKQRKEAAMK
jgi:hypothetical protein